MTDNRIRVLVSGENLRKGGGRSVLHAVLGGLASTRRHVLTALVPLGFGNEAEGVHTPDVTLLEKRAWSPVALANLAPHHDILLGLGNWAVPGLRIPQVTLCHWPYALYDDPEIWQRLSPHARMTRRAKRALFDSLIPFSDVVLLQTEVARSRLLSRHPGSETALLPNVVDSALANAAREVPAPRRPPHEILVLARYYPHKNFEILLPLAEAIREAERPWRIRTTLDPTEHPRVAAFLQEVSRRRLSPYLVNLGPIPRHQLEGAYRAASVLLLPSLLESFSGTYLEAMAFGLPILTSDRDFAHAVCGSAARYADPHDATSLMRGLDDILLDETEYRSMVGRGRERIRSFPSWNQVIARLGDVIESACRR